MDLKSNRHYVPLSKGNRGRPKEQQISVEIKRLTVRDTFAIQTQVRQAMGRERAVEEALAKMDLSDPEQLERFWQVVEWVISRHTENWRGIRLDSKEITDPAELISSCGAEHIDLLLEVSNETIRGSKGGEEDLKNSALESVPVNSDSALTVSPASPPASNGKEIALDVG